jgi:sialic acid synthase SpsE
LRFGQEIGVTRYKLASGDITFKQLIESVASMKQLVILSTGASTEAEIRRAVGWVTQRNTNLIVLACTSSYPCPPSEAHLARMKSLRPIWPEVGYSDHTFGVGAIERAAHLGAVLVEKHFTIRPGSGGDHDFAVVPKQLQNLVDMGKGEDRFDGSPLLEPVKVEMKARAGARRSLHTIVDKPAGSILGEADLIALRPGGGLEPWQADDYVGRPLAVDVPAWSILDWNMF